MLFFVGKKNFGCEWFLFFSGELKENILIFVLILIVIILYFDIYLMYFILFILYFFLLVKF